MTEQTRPNGGDTLACQITLYRRESYVAVKLIMKNLREEAITVDYQQTVPDALTTTHLSFTSNYLADGWVFEDSRLHFSTEIGGREQIETVYGIKRVDISSLVDFISYATIVAKQDGNTVETVTSIDPDIERTNDGTERASTDDETTSVMTTENTANAPPETQEASAVGRSIQETQHSEQTADQSHSTTGADTERTSSTEAPTDDSTDTDETVQWETLSTESENDADETAETTATNEHVPFASAEETSPQQSDDEKPALPANRSDYILEDVREEIDSPAEFNWIEVDSEPEKSETADSDGIIGWVRSRLPL
ncbi:hypothetical protein ACFQJ7_07625 [Halovenus rubra]|uniref:Uncharacterized protein n=2 Tax=Halovenus rubra TaxID=869890 RepID=A0ABD5X403_9EURY|nr:hypothetical protein [Halovenus rubra]